MAIGILTGSGTYVLPGLSTTGSEPVFTEWGEAFVSHGTWGGVEVLHISRHGDGHPRLSNHVTHRANITASEAAGRDRRAGRDRVRRRRSVGGARLRRVLRRPALSVEPDGRRFAVHVLHRTGREGARALDLRVAVLGGPAARAADGRRGSGRARAGRRLLRPRGRAALQHARRDPRARRRGRHCGVPDGRAGDRAVRRARVALRAPGLPDRLRERRARTRRRRSRRSSR